jgi:hypothetical protein
VGQPARAQAGGHGVRIDAITVGERRREDYGDIDGLAASIQKYGLLHPIVVDEAGALVAGGRRLQAVKSLGWTDVPVRSLGELTDAERDEIELEENLQRKDLTATERSKTVAKLAETAAHIIKAEQEVFVDSAKTQGGRPPKNDVPLREVAERIGVPEATIRAAQKHVEIAETIPVLAGPDVKQYHALEAREKLERIPEPDRQKAVALVNQPGTPPKVAVEILGNLAAMPAPQRERVLTLAESKDPSERSLAMTEAAKLPPMPDERIPLLIDVLAILNRATRIHPDDDMAGAIVVCRDTVKDTLANLKEYSRGR